MCKPSIFVQFSEIVILFCSFLFYGGTVLIYLEAILVGMFLSRLVFCLVLVLLETIVMYFLLFINQLKCIKSYINYTFIILSI